MKYNGKSFSYSNNTNIDLLNVDHLYDYLYEIDHDPNRSLGQNILNLLNHVSVTLYLSDVSIPEFLFLKKIASNVGLFTNLHFHDKGYEKEVIKYILEYYNFMEREILDKKRFTNPFFGLPMGVISGDCIVEFSGSQIGYVMNTDFTKFFIKSLENTCIDEKGKLMKINILDEKYYNKIVSSIKDIFKNNFYKEYTDFLGNVDMQYEKFDMNKYHKDLSDENPIMLYSIRSLSGNINLLEDSKELMHDKFEKLGDMCNKVDSFIMRNNTYLEFSISSTLYSYFILNNIIKKDNFITNINLITPSLVTRNLLSKSTFHNSLLPEYEKRFEKYYISMYKSISDNYKEVDIPSIELSSLDSKVSYSIRLNLIEIDHFLKYMDSNFKVDKSILDLSVIRSKIKVFYNSINSIINK